MDQSPQPSPTTPASNPSDISPALPNSPETQAPQARPSTPAPQDPYAAYAHVDYAQLLQEFPVEGMDAKELATVYGPARQAISQFGAPGLTDALERTGAGSDGNMLRGLASIHRDYQGLLNHVRQMNTSYKGLAQSLGQRVSAIDPPPLTGEALERETIKFLDYYFPTTSREAYARGFAQEPAVMQTITRLVQEFSRLERSLHQAGTQREQMQAQRESPSAVRTLPDGRRYTNEDLDLEIERLWGLRHTASRANDLNEIERLDKLIVRLGKTRFGG